MNRALPSLLAFCSLGSLAGLALAGGTVADPAAEPMSSAAMKPKVYRNWSIRMPDEQWSKVGTRFRFEHDSVVEFEARLEGTSLRVDSDGDGELDVKVDGPEGTLILTRGDWRYAVRLRAEPEWSYAPASVMNGEVAGARVRVIDQNNNGRFNDIGEDAMVVGKGKVASLLSKVVSVDSKLYSVEVNADGLGLRYELYTGPTSKLSLKGTTEGKVLGAVVKSQDGQYSFAYSSKNVTAEVPAGDYALHRGTLVFGGSTVTLSTGRSQPVAMIADASGTIEWGAPVAAEFAMKPSEEGIEFDPNQIWYYGKSGEEYTGWDPLGKSPKISLVSKSGREIAQAFFPGSC